MKTNYIFVILLFILSSGFSQTGFYGIISDSKQQVLPYSNIYLSMNRIGTSSSTKGHYQFQVKDIKYKYDTLIVSFLGYETKRIPVILGGHQEQDIVLKPTKEKIKSVRVNAEKPKYTALQIIKKARNKVRKNYVNQTVVQEGFYRETLKENGITLKINECALDFKSSGYPKAKFSRRSFIDQNDDLWDNNLTGIAFSQFAQYWPLYISTDEKVNITSSRVSIDRSSQDGKYKRIGDPYGGPIDIIGLNNIKYKLDFFNPKLTKKYNYKIVDLKYIDSNLCYVINYRRKDTFSFIYWHQYNKKARYTLFEGEIIVRKKDFSVMAFSSESINWHNCLSVMDKKSKTFLTFNPNKISFHVDFQETEQGLILNAIQYESNFNSVLDNTSNYKWYREIVLSQPKDKVFEENSIDYFPTRHRTLRNRVTSYDSEFWKTFETSSLYLPLSKREKEDLEVDIPLSNQFELINQTVAEIPKPKFEGKYAEIFESSKSTPIDSILFNHYVEEEDDYANIIFQKLNDYERGFRPGWILDKDYDATPPKPKKKPQYFRQHDTLGTYFVYENINDTTAKSIFNLSYESTNNKGGQIYNYNFSKPYVFIDIKDVKQLSHTLKIKRKANIQTIDSICNINEFLLINDSTVAYTTFKNNRPSSLYLHRVGDAPKEDILLYFEPDVEYDLELSETSSEVYTIVDITSKDQNEICVINKENLQFKQVYKRQHRAHVKLDHFAGDDHFTSLVSSQKYYILKTNISSFVSDTLIRSTKAIEDFYGYKNNLVYTEYETFKMRMVQFDLDQQTSQYIELQKGFSFIEFYKTKQTKDSLVVYIESAIHPSQAYKINVNTGKYRLVDEYKYSNSHQKSNYQSEVIHVKSDDGIEVPVLIYYDKKAISDSVTALLIQSYGPMAVLMW